MEIKKGISQPEKYPLLPVAKNQESDNMITFNNKLSNSIFDKNTNIIDNLNNFSNIIEVIHINKLDFQITSNILKDIKEYENYIKANDFSDLKCPLCKHDNVLHYHKEYQRDLIFQINDNEIISKITITVLECSYCKKMNKGKQLYHALLPAFIFPYHIYSGNIILDTLNKRLIEEEKIQQIIEKRNISHQLFYKWLKGFKKYSISASTILECDNNIIDIIKAIIKDPHSFLLKFFKTFYHPFFLFRLTCVPLVIMP